MDNDFNFLLEDRYIALSKNDFLANDVLKSVIF